MPSGHPEQRPDLSVRVIEHETIILDREANQVHQLNATASLVWQRCDGQHSAGQIADVLLEVFDVDPHTARDAVVTSLRRFAELGLLRPAGG
jgi:Coenzyme PQQ synthesis protein D (PqqD)